MEFIWLKEKNNFQAFNIIGSSFLNLKKFDSAIKYFNHCVKLKNDYSPALNNLGLALVSKGDIEVGIKYFQKL